MKRTATVNSGVVKLSLTAGSLPEDPSRKRQQRIVPSATHPSWMRYIDSRLKQFGAFR